MKVPLFIKFLFSIDQYYGGHETLLHFALRLRLEKTSSFMLTDDIVTNYKGLLDLRGYDKKRPLEIARERGLSEIGDRMLTLLTAQASPQRVHKKLYMAVCLFDSILLPQRSFGMSTQLLSFHHVFLWPSRRAVWPQSTCLHRAISKG